MSLHKILVGFRFKYYVDEDEASPRAKSYHLNLSVAWQGTWHDLVPVGSETAYLRARKLAKPVANRLN